MQARSSESVHTETDNRTLRILDWPKSERPRERLLSNGVGALSNSELLALLLGSGLRGLSALDLARKLLSDQGLESLRNLHAKSMKGVGAAKVARVLAALELGRRLHSGPESLPERITTPETAFAYVRSFFHGKQEECFVVVPVDVKNRPLALRELARGTTEGVAIEPRYVLIEALRLGASGILCAHNHPSGDPTPSAEDRHLTRRLKESAALVGLRFLDHLVVANERFATA